VPRGRITVKCGNFYISRARVVVKNMDRHSRDSLPISSTPEIGVTFIMTFESFDPLSAKANATTEVATLAQKREIINILGSYVGWYDPFCELIQNALDSVEERSQKEGPDYTPRIWVTIDIKTNSLTVTDNGVGLDKEKFVQFLCPDISFKPPGKRGHKGVGATYLAYGFNFIQVSTKTPDFSAIGKMQGAKAWLTNPSPSGNPQMKPDTEHTKDTTFEGVDRGVSVYVKFDADTHPKDLKWIVASTGEAWHKILSVKTGLGAFTCSDSIHVTIKVFDRDGKESTYHHKGVEYLWPHRVVVKSASINAIQQKEHELLAKRGAGFTLPANMTNLDCFYERWDAEGITSLLTFNTEELEIIEKYKPTIYASYVYSVKTWDAINESLGVRSGSRILYGGIQLCANNMPQGEIIQIPLYRNIGRQNNIHMVIHFDNCSADLGRKGFNSEIVEFAKETARKIADGVLSKVQYALKPNTGVAPNLTREKIVDDWKEEMTQHEVNSPLVISNEAFFLPTKKIALTSTPTREQDVIALFNQLLAGGVVRGVRIMSTNERLTYDGLYRIIMEEPSAHHLFDRQINPLGITREVLLEMKLPFLSRPKILEYKFSLDGLIEDIEDGEKNSNDIGLVVVWETEELYKAKYKITSLLDEDNLSFREYHGVTHTITNITTRQKEMDLIVLSELIEYLNDPKASRVSQKGKYDE